MAERAGIAGIVSELSARFETSVGSDWRFEFERDDLRRQLRGIVGFTLRPSKIEMKFKLNQNHPRANVESVAAALAGGDDKRRAISALMLAALVQDKGERTP